MDADLTRWWRYHRLSTGPRPDRAALARGEHAQIEAAHERVQSVVLDNTPDALRVLEALARLAADEAELAYLGAGIVEDYVLEHGNAEYQAVARTAGESAAFAAALSSAWVEPGDMSPEAISVLRRWIPELARKLDRTGP